MKSSILAKRQPTGFNPCHGGMGIYRIIFMVVNMGCMGFNPCHGGMGIYRTSIADFELASGRFQSLSWWNGDLQRNRAPNSRDMRQ